MQTQDRPKIEPHHLRRLAVVYVRLATVDHGFLSRASRLLQRAQREHALRWGWPRSAIRIVEDLGRGGEAFENRAGMQRILEWIAWSHVGLLLASDMSRLTRSRADFETLVKLCQDAETLLAVNGMLVETQVQPTGYWLSRIQADVTRYWDGLR